MGGRELRRVPPGWEHPRRQKKESEEQEYCPLFDEDYESAANEWVRDCLAWDVGTHPDLADDPSLKDCYPYYWEWNGSPPDKTLYRPKWETEPTWYQIYEIVSEGTPVTPAFATKRELVDYLMQYGDYWDQQRGDGGWPQQVAEAFIECEYAPSLTAARLEDGVIVKAPRDGQF